jgi:hypothetical protein
MQTRLAVSCQLVKAELKAGQTGEASLKHRNRIACLKRAFAALDAMVAYNVNAWFSNHQPKYIFQSHLHFCSYRVIMLVACKALPHNEAPFGMLLEN